MKAVKENMMKVDITPYSEADRARFIRGLVNGLLLSIPLWAVIICGVSFFF